MLYRLNGLSRRMIHTALDGTYIARNAIWVGGCKVNELRYSQVNTHYSHISVCVASFTSIL